MPQTETGSRLVDFMILVRQYGVDAVFLLMLALARSGRDIERLMGLMPEDQRLLPHHVKLMRQALQDLRGEAGLSAADPVDSAKAALMLHTLPPSNLCQYYRNALDQDRDKAPGPDAETHDWDAISTHLERREATNTRSVAPRQLTFDAILCGVECFVRMTVRHKSEPDEANAGKLGRSSDVHVRIFIADRLLTEPIVRELHNKVIKPTSPFTNSRKRMVRSTHLEFGYLLKTSGLLEHLELVSMASTVHHAYFCTGRETLARNLQAALVGIGVPIENLTVVER